MSSVVHQRLLREISFIASSLLVKMFCCTPNSTPKLREGRWKIALTTSYREGSFPLSKAWPGAVHPAAVNRLRLSRSNTRFDIQYFSQPYFQIFKLFLLRRSQLLRKYMVMIISYTFLLQETMVSFPFNEILSTRNLRTDTGRIYLDLKCGNLMVQKVTRMETPRVKSRFCYPYYLKP